jgi:3-deoxy-D-manno-octulosonate 8-phosphate phosphatase (KDO 8-P phosphatase)
MSYKEEFKHITTFVFDVDGVFTDGSITILPDGEMIRTMNTKDGYAVKAALHAGFGVVIISGGNKRSRKNAPQSIGCPRRVFGSTPKGKHTA